MKFESDERLKGYLKNESKRLGISIKNTYNTFFARDLLQRISNIGCKNIFVKGSFSGFVNLGRIERPIVDVDVATQGCFVDGFSELTDCINASNDELSYEVSGNSKITKTGIHKLKVMASFGKIKHPMSIDFHENVNTVYEKKYKLTKPIFKFDTPFHILTPSHEEHLAEKLCIVVENNRSDVLNTRLKDFYDIYKLHGGKYDKEKFSDYFFRKLVTRNKIDITDVTTAYLNKDYINRHQELWNSMSEKCEFLDKNLKFQDAVYGAKEMLDQELIKLDRKGKIKIK